MLEILQNRLRQEHINLEFSDRIKAFIINNSYSHEYGARPIKRFIQREIETIIAKAIISGEIVPNVQQLVDVKDDKIFIK